MMYTSFDLMGAEIVFCVEFEWCGKIHRYSTRGLHLSSVDGELEYLPTIIDFDFVESADITSIDIESNVVSMALIIQDANYIEQWSKGFGLDGVDAEFFYILTKFDTPVSDYESRVVLYRGQIQEPQFGGVDEVENFVSFSIESQLSDGDRLLLDSNLLIDDRFHHRDISTGDGKNWTIVFGDAGYKIQQTINTTKSVYAIPAYNVHHYDSHDDCRMMIAGHPVLASNATIQDDNFQTATKSIFVDDDGRGNLYSYIELKTSDNVAMPNYSGSGDSRQWWVYMDGDGIVSPYSEEGLTGGGDLCRWALSKTGQKVDDDAWANLSPLLNQYSFDGYINDGSITAFDWLQGKILPHLPISIRLGPNGIKPILIEMWALVFVSPVASVEIGDDKEWILESTINTMRSTADLINQYTFRFGKRGFDQEYTSQIRVSHIGIESYDVISDYSITSVNKYGVKPSTGQSDYVYDRDTAILIAQSKVRANSLPLYQIEVSTPMEYGWIQIGDVLSVSVQRFYFTNHKMMVISKQFRDGQWLMTLAFEINPIQNDS